MCDLLTIVDAIFACVYALIGVVALVVGVASIIETVRTERRNDKH